VFSLFHTLSPLCSVVSVVWRKEGWGGGDVIYVCVCVCVCVCVLLPYRKTLKMNKTINIARYSK